MTNTRPALTPRQREVLELLQVWLLDHGFAPTVQEIADYFGISKTGAWQHLDALEDKGYIVRSIYRRRAIELAGDQRHVRCPHCKQGFQVPV